MECNKEEARSAMDIAESKLSKNDYVGAKKFVIKAQNLYPKLDGLKQVFMIVDVFISASNGGGGEEADWYGILGVDPLADVKTVKKQYKKLALLLHPDKNKFNGAEEAFKLVSNACSLLSDKAKRSAYDQKRKWKQVQQKQKPQTPQKPREPHEPQKPREPQKPHEPASSTTSKAEKEAAKAAKEAAKEEQERWNRWYEGSRQKAASSTTPACAKVAQEAQERWYRLFQESRGNVDAAVARENAKEAERLFKKPMRTTTTNSTHRFFKKADTFVT